MSDLPDEVPMPEVRRLCTVCGTTDEEALSGRVVVSPRGVAHHGDEDGGWTSCGCDGTADGWWWPL